MKLSHYVLFTAFVFCTYTSFHKTNPANNLNIDDLNRSGYAFTVNVTKINSQYSEIPSAIFRNKLVIVSSKKIGALGNGIDKNTQQPYSNLYCTDLNGENQFSTPILFSRILNTRGSEGQVSFSPDEHTIYYTRSERKNSSSYKLYKAELIKDSFGKWVNHSLVNINGHNFSIENPHVSADGKELYFSSNMQGGFGGFDLYKSKINEGGSLSKPLNLGSSVNTESDEKYPFVTKNEKELYFSSKGHTNQGGFDIFISNRLGELSYSEPRNLGRKINSKKDDIAFTLVDEDNGVFSSDEGNLNKHFNMYKFNAKVIYQNLEGIVTSEKNEILPNAVVILYDENGIELERQITSDNGSYSFKIRPFDNYHIKALKNGFNEIALDFKSNSPEIYIAYKEDLKLSTDVAKKR